jgi:hypothetical protein
VQNGKAAVFSRDSFFALRHICHSECLADISGMPVPPR